MEEQVIQERIDRYLLHRMDEEERRSFEEEMKADDSLRRKVEEQSAVIKTIRKVGRERDAEVLRAMNRLSDEDISSIIHVHNRRRKENGWFPTLFAAACVIGIVIANSFFLRQSQCAALYAEYFTPYQTQQIMRGSADNSLFLQGYQCWMNGDSPKAIQMLSQIVRIGDSDVSYQDAEWYLSLFYLKEKDITNCRILLQRIILERGYYSDKAKEVLNRIGNQ